MMGAYWDLTERARKPNASGEIAEYLRTEYPGESLAAVVTGAIPAGPARRPTGPARGVGRLWHPIALILHG